MSLEEKLSKVRPCFVKPRQGIDTILRHSMLALEELILGGSYRSVLSASKSACSPLWITAEDLSLLIQEALMLHLDSQLLQGASWLKFRCFNIRSSLIFEHNPNPYISFRKGASVPKKFLKNLVPCQNLKHPTRGEPIAPLQVTSLLNRLHCWKATQHVVASLYVSGFTFRKLISS